MPMFKALELCPEAAVVISRGHGEICAGRPRGPRQAMQTLTPLVEPLSIDEAFLDLSGTERLHGAIAGQAAGAPSAPRCRAPSIGITVSVGLSLQQVPGQDRLRSRQAARLRGDRSAARRADAGGAAGRLHLRRRPGHPGTAGASAASAPSAICSAPTRST
ncbi:MAG: hypothetical protein MZV49_23810 [Rhodopseudomonas palustris]|nr:hypothetical protein [Rhodopseudomonas palustris]